MAYMVTFCLQSQFNQTLKGLIGHYLFVLLYRVRFELYKVEFQGNKLDSNL
jgi:hypothetical protein